MQVAKHAPYRLFSEDRCATTFAGVCHRTDRGRGPGQIQVRSMLLVLIFALSYLQRYPYVSTEVLCSEIWSIVETCLNNTDQLLVPFWETVLDRTPEDMRTRMTMASQFAKINAVFLSKKPAEVTAAFLRHPVANSETRCRCSNSSEHSETSSNEYSNTLRCPPSQTSSCE
jgi:hypothetical protein